MRHLILSLAATLGLAATSEAVPITFRFAGVLDAVEGASPGHVFAVGEAFTGTFGFDLDLPGAGDDDARRFDATSSLPVRLSIDFPEGSFQKDATDTSGFVEVTRDGFRLVTGFPSGSSISISLVNESGPAFAAAVLPSELSGGQFTIGRVDVQGPDWAYRGAVDLDSVERAVGLALPEPSTLVMGLVGAGLVGLGWLRRVRLY